MSVLSLLLALVLSPSLAAEPEQVERPINLWPLIYSEKGPDYRQVELLFSLIYYERDRRKLSLGFRPFYSRTADPENDASEWDFIWPIAHYERAKTERKLRVAPLFWQKLDTDDSYSVFFPFYSYHRDLNRRKTGVIGFSPYSLFDFRKNLKTGSTRNRYLLVTSERDGPNSSFSIAPLYSQTKTPDSGSASLFPVFHRAWNRPEGYSHFSMIGMPERFNLFETKRHDKEELREWHFLLVFSRRHKADEIFFAAPVYWRWRTEKLDLFHVWPFYGVTRKEFSTERSVVWPFFRYSVDPSEKETDLNLLWPLMRTLRRPQFKHDRLFPFFAWTRQSEDDKPPKSTSFGLFAPVPLFYRSTGLDYAYNRFFWLAWKTRRGDRQRDFILNYYKLADASDGTLHAGLFPLWHRSRWPGHKLDLAPPLYVSYQKPDLAFTTLFPLYWDYHSSSTTLTAGIPLYLRYKSGRYDFKTIFPFYWHSTDPELGGELTYYFPFYGTYKRGGVTKRHLLFFPLWSRLKDEEAGLESWDVAWPLFHYGTGPTRSSARVLPFYWQRRSPEGSFAMGFPFYWRFQSAETEHTHVLPFYGSYRKKDFKLQYYLGPAAVHMSDVDFERTDVLGSLWSKRRQGDETRTHLFPLYWSRSHAGYGTRLLLPLFGAEHADPGYRSWFFLGVHKSVNLFRFAWDAKEDYRLTRALNVYYRKDRSSWFGTFFPIYWTWGGDRSSSSIFFPLYSLSRDDSEGSYDRGFLGLPEGLSLIEFSKNRSQDQEAERVLLYYHRRAGDRHMRTVFPLYWKWWEPGMRRTFLFPLYASRKMPDEDQWGLLGISPDISLFSYGHDDHKRLTHRLFPLYGYRETKDERQLSLFGFWHKISLFYAEKSADAVRHRFIPVYGFEKSPDKVQASLLWRVLYYQREKDTTDFRFLFRLLRVQDGPDRSAFELNPFYFNIRDPKSRYWAILGGLYGVETFPDGHKKRRFLWFF